MSVLLRLMKNVTYATPSMTQINLQKCMLQSNDDFEYNQVNFILLSVRKMHTECSYVYLHDKCLLIQMGGVTLYADYPLL